MSQPGYSSYRYDYRLPGGAPEQGRQESNKSAFLRYCVLAATVLFALGGLATLVEWAVQAAEQAPVPLLYHDVEQPEPTNYRLHTWQYLD